VFHGGHLVITYPGIRIFNRSCITVSFNQEFLLRCGPDSDWIPLSTMTMAIRIIRYPKLGLFERLLFPLFYTI